MAATLTPSVAMASSARIHRHQYFVGEINGKASVAISMACFGPVRPGQMGHPFGGQTIGVAQVAAAAIPSPAPGYTGMRGTSIIAFFGPPTTATSAVAFKAYGTQPLPTSLFLPCAGSGTVMFTPLPTSSSARSFTLQVEYVGQP